MDRKGEDWVNEALLDGLPVGSFLFFSYIVSSNELHQELHCQDIPGKLENSGAQRVASDPG